MKLVLRLIRNEAVAAEAQLAEISSRWVISETRYVEFARYFYPDAF